MRAGTRGRRKLRGKVSEKWLREFPLKALRRNEKPGSRRRRTVKAPAAAARAASGQVEHRCYDGCQRDEAGMPPAAIRASLLARRSGATSAAGPCLGVLSGCG